MKRMHFAFLICMALGLASVAACSKANPRISESAGGGLTGEHVRETGHGSKESHGEEEKHEHEEGAHGGTIVPLGRDNYHVEAIVTNEGELQLYTLGSDETKVQDVKEQELTAFVKAEDARESQAIKLLPRPQPGDAEGKTSMFGGPLPIELQGKGLRVTIPNISIEGDRFRIAFATHSEPSRDHQETSAMEDKVEGAAEAELYLTPGGIYKQTDIEANGSVAASVKFAGMRSQHDAKPAPGDKICPISLGKANPDFAWVVGGKKYEFCCPPCVDEFVALAKNNPSEIKEPEEYVK